MSKTTTTEYFCDRCKVSLGDKEPPRKVKVNAYAEGEWAMDFVAEWVDLCEPCCKACYRFFTGQAS